MTDSSNSNVETHGRASQTVKPPITTVQVGDVLKRTRELLAENPEAEPMEAEELPLPKSSLINVISDGKKYKPPRAKVMFRDLEVKRGYKTQVALVLYAILKTGVLTNRKTKKPITIMDFTRLIKHSNMDLNIRNLCHRTILRPDPNDTSTTTKFLRDIITTIEEHSQ